MADEHRSFFRRGKASDREAAGEVDFLFRRRGGFAAETFGEVDRHGLDETIVPLRQRLYGGGGFVAPGHAHGMIGAVERR